MWMVKVPPSLHICSSLCTLNIIAYASVLIYKHKFSTWYHITVSDQNDNSFQCMFFWEMSWQLVEDWTNSSRLSTGLEIFRQYFANFCSMYFCTRAEPMRTCIFYAYQWNSLQYKPKWWELYPIECATQKGFNNIHECPIVNNWGISCSSFVTTFQLFDGEVYLRVNMNVLLRSPGTTMGISQNSIPIKNRQTRA
jgi:hypothetical protein